VPFHAEYVRNVCSAVSQFYTRLMSAIRFFAILMLSSLAVAQQPSNPLIGKSNTPKPELPVIDEYACPGKGNIVPNVKIDKDDRIFPSWNENEKSIGTLKAGEEVTVLGGANVIREPGTAIIKYVRPDDSLCSRSEMLPLFMV